MELEYFYGTDKLFCIIECTFPKVYSPFYGANKPFSTKTYTDTDPDYKLFI